MCVCRVSVRYVHMCRVILLRRLKKGRLYLSTSFIRDNSSTNMTRFSRLAYQSSFSFFISFLLLLLPPPSPPSSLIFLPLPLPLTFLWLPFFSFLLWYFSSNLRRKIFWFSSYSSPPSSPPPPPHLLRLLFPFFYFIYFFLFAVTPPYPHPPFLAPNILFLGRISSRYYVYTRARVHMCLYVCVCIYICLWLCRFSYIRNI